MVVRSLGVYDELVVYFRVVRTYYKDPNNGTRTNFAKVIFGFGNVMKWSALMVDRWLQAQSCRFGSCCILTC